MNKVLKGLSWILIYNPDVVFIRVWTDLNEE